MCMTQRILLRAMISQLKGRYYLVAVLSQHGWQDSHVVYTSMTGRPWQDSHVVRTATNVGVHRRVRTARHAACCVFASPFGAQPQASRHALSTCDSNLLALFSIMPAQAQQAYAFTPNAPSRGLYRPLNIMYGNYAQSGLCGRVAPRIIRHYIKCPQPPPRWLRCLGQAENLFMFPPTPKGAIKCVRKRTSSLWPPSPCLLRCVPRPNNTRWVSSVALF